MCDDVASDSLHRGCDFGQRPGMQGHVRVCGFRVGVPAAPCGATVSTRTPVNPIQAPAPGAVRASTASVRFRRGRCSYAPRASPLASLARFLCLLHATFATPGVLRVTRNAHGFVRIRYNYGFLHTAVRLYLRPYTTCKLSMGPTIHIFFQNFGGLFVPSSPTTSRRVDRHCPNADIRARRGPRWRQRPWRWQLH